MNDILKHYKFFDIITSYYQFHFYQNNKKPDGNIYLLNKTI